MVCPIRDSLKTGQDQVNSVVGLSLAAADGLLARFAKLITLPVGCVLAGFELLLNAFRYTTGLCSSEINASKDYAAGIRESAATVMHDIRSSAETKLREVLVEPSLKVKHEMVGKVYASLNRSAGDASMGNGEEKGEGSVHSDNNLAAAKEEVEALKNDD